MPSNLKSYVRNGQAYYSKTGRYNEVKLSAKNGVNNDAPSAQAQKNLAPTGNKTAAAQTMKAVLGELGWIKK